ncbi:MAG: DUF2752 domain-containing protein [Planctomycetes bacterium]|nr:DUF2752 domain-containing protein [Planctomycetota bacterium]
MAETSQQATPSPTRERRLTFERVPLLPQRARPACGAAHGRTWPRTSAAEKAAQGILAAVMAASLAAGLLLTASPTGTGTHTVLGLPPCGMLVVTGRPCPTCGVTTSFVLAAHGRFYEAMVNQPFGLVVFFLATGGLICSVATLATGRSWLPLLTVNRVLALGLILTALGLVSWAYKWSTM